MLKSVLVATSVAVLSAVTALGWNAAPEPSPASAKFVGASSCKKCHLEQHKTWLDSGHSRAWEVLPEKYHDPAQKDEKGQACVSCHTTGFEHEAKGGFVNIHVSPKLTGVQCEACHGPGSQHEDAAMELVMKKRDAFEDGEQSFITLTPTNCTGCHNPHVSYEQYAEG
jgi:hypothetical protein